MGCLTSVYSENKFPFFNHVVRLLSPFVAIRFSVECRVRGVPGSLCVPDISQRPKLMVPDTLLRRSPSSFFDGHPPQEYLDELVH